MSGHHFDVNGQTSDLEFHQRLVGIAQDDLLRVPARLAVAGSPAKAEAILGALRAGYVTILVTDSLAAARVLELAGVDVNG